MTALVTGGGRGIGRAIALRLAKAGFSVAVTARSADQLAGTAALAEGTVVPITADIGDPAAVRAMVREAEDRLGSIDLLVNNAAIGGPLGLFWELDMDRWWECLEVNLRGPQLCCGAVMPGMIERRRGCIVNVASGAGCLPFPDMSAYAVSKTALIRLSEQLAMEARPHGVSVFAIRPGLVRTALVEGSIDRLPFIQKMFDDGLENPPEAAADLVLFLASGKADALSGRLFSVHDDPEATAARADDILAGELYVLRVRTEF
jgi:NAD(P)-dependent dehydrogenase (short-subunit alcohol dehydrogenase family)